MKYLLIIKKMFKNIFCIIILSLLFNACQSVKDGLTGKKKNNSDEFLIQKKNPLSQPPQFEELPVPKELTKKEKKEENEISVKSLITKDVSKTETSSISKTSSGSLEKSVLDKIKSN